MRFLYLGFILLFVACSKPGMLYEFSHTEYSNIPSDLSENAHSIIRESNTELIIHDVSKASYREQVAMTILNEEHAKLGIVGVPYDQLSAIEYMNVRVIGRSGDVIETFSMSDAYDFSQYDGVSFFSDNRIKIIDTHSSTYPYTVEYEYEKTLFGTLNLPTWIPMNPDQSVESAIFTIQDNATGVRTHSVNFEGYSEHIEYDENAIQKWSFKNVPAKETEPYSPILDNIPYLLVAPGTFEIGGSRGDASTWEAFGKWYYELGKETRVLPEAAKKEIDQLVEGLTNQEEIVSVLFNYLQDKNRYVSIQLGIGGWKPFSAEFVYNNSYGDCKALTNYMQAALNYVGIEANAVLINASNSRALIEEFSGNQFNHVVLKVELDNGTEIWLECTSKYLPPNNLGNGYSKKALLISEEGGVIVQTPDITYLDNAENRVYNLVISEDGSVHIEGNLEYKGAYQSRVLHQLLPVSLANRKEWLTNQLVGDIDKISTADFEKVSSQLNTATITFEASINSYANASSKRLFIPINKLNRWRFNLEDNAQRELPFRFNHAFVESDSIHFMIPDGYEIESFPRERMFEEEFASYTSKLEKLDNRTFIFNRVMEVKQKEIPAENYNALRSFLNDVRRADSQQLVLVKIEP